LFTNANGIPVQRAAQPSAAAINALPRRLALTTLFITIPVSLTSNLFGITSSLIVSSPIPQIRDAARKIRLNDVYADKDGYKTYHQPRSPRGPAYEFVVPPLFLSDPAVLLANNSPRTYARRRASEASVTSWNCPPSKQAKEERLHGAPTTSAAGAGRISGCRGLACPPARALARSPARGWFGRRSPRSPNPSPPPHPLTFILLASLAQVQNESFGQRLA
jgi:hypothetical protein